MRRRRLPLLLALVVAACGRDDAAKLPAGSALSAAADSAPVAVTGEWPPELGNVLVIPADTENLAVVLYPASPSGTLDANTELALLAPGGDAVRLRTRLSAPDSAHCGDAPILHLARATPAVWALGVGTSKARPMKLDSLEALTHEDSLLYSVEMARLGSTVSAAATSRLTGLSYSLVGVRRLRFGDTTIVAAQLVRRVNQEANPAEERTLVVAEQVGRGQFTTVHSDRSEGTEESAAHFDLIGAFRAGSTLYLLVSTDSASGSTIEILERSAGVWRVRWSRTIAC